MNICFESSMCLSKHNRKYSLIYLQSVRSIHTMKWNISIHVTGCLDIYSRRVQMISTVLPDRSQINQKPNKSSSWQVGKNTTIKLQHGQWIVKSQSNWRNLKTMWTRWVCIESPPSCKKKNLNIDFEYSKQKVKKSKLAVEYLNKMNKKWLPQHQLSMIIQLYLPHMLNGLMSPQAAIVSFKPDYVAFIRLSFALLSFFSSNA